MIKMVRSIISSVAEGVIKRFSGSGRPGETIANREYFQHYGFTSWPLPGGEMVLLVEDNRIVGIASDDRRYRVTLQEGEVALYTDEGDFVHFKRGNTVHVNTGGTLQVDAATEVVVNTGDATVNCSGKATVTAGGGVDLDGGSGSPLGVVQGGCICHFTGAPHADISTNVKASK